MRLLRARPWALCRPQISDPAHPAGEHCIARLMLLRNARPQLHAALAQAHEALEGGLVVEASDYEIAVFRDLLGLHRDDGAGAKSELVRGAAAYIEEVVRGRGEQLARGHAPFGEDGLIRGDGFRNRERYCFWSSCSRI